MAVSARTLNALSDPGVPPCPWRGGGAVASARLANALTRTSEADGQSVGGVYKPSFGLLSSSSYFVSHFINTASPAASLSTIMKFTVLFATLAAGVVLAAPARKHITDRLESLPTLLGTLKFMRRIH